MDFDNLAEKRSETLFATWLQSLLRNDPEILAATLARAHCKLPSKSAKLLAHGGCNFCYQVTLENDQRVVVRFTAIGRVLPRHEKVEAEVAVLKYLAEHTQIPVPKVFGHGSCHLGPYIVMEYFEGNMMCGYLRDPANKRFSLRPGLHPRVLERAYQGMADVLLELSKPEFPLIGALVRNEDGSFVVGKRPVTLNMNRIAQFSNIPLSVFSERTFDNAGDYFDELARQHMEQLVYQQNDAVEDAADCRKKFVARCLFRRLSRSFGDEHCTGPFRLFCDDLCPRNIIVDESRLAVAGVVDWEFTYVAPAEFTYAAPWWLLLENPERWDLDEFLARYEPKFRVFIKALKERETEKIRCGALQESGRISTIMETSLDSGLFWICLSLRHSALFDEIYWKFIDPKFFGNFDSIEQRISLLDPGEQVKMERLVQEKLRQAEEAKLDHHYTVEQLVEL